MSENVIIKEGGSGRRMPNTSRLVTSDGSSTDYWVPLSDRLTATKYISKNGEYEAEREGLHSWSKVHVGIYGGAAGLTIPTATDPYSGIEIPTGVDGVIDPVPPAGLEPLEPIDALDIEDILDVDDISDIDLTDPTTIEDLSPTIEPTGSVISGINPITDRPETVKEDKDGNAEQKSSPMFKVIVPPNKTTYRLGEKMDYTGIVCALYTSYNEQINNNGSFNIQAEPYHDDRYKDARVPFNELLFPLTTAVGNKVSGKVLKYKGEYITSIENKSLGRSFTKLRDGVAYYTLINYDNKWFGPLLVGLSPDAVSYHVVELKAFSGDEADSFSAEYVTYNGTTYYYNHYYHLITDDEDAHYNDSLNDVVMKAVAYFDTYVTQGKNRIPVEWINPYDNKVYTDYFDIIIT